MTFSVFMNLCLINVFQFKSNESLYLVLLELFNQQFCFNFYFFSAFILKGVTEKQRRSKETTVRSGSFRTLVSIWAVRLVIIITSSHRYRARTQQEASWPDDLHLTGMLRDVWDQAAFQFSSPATDPHLPQGRVTWPQKKSPLPVVCRQWQGGFWLLAGSTLPATSSEGSEFHNRAQYCFSFHW